MGVRARVSARGAARGPRTIPSSAISKAVVFRNRAEHRSTPEHNSNSTHEPSAHRMEVSTTQLNQQQEQGAGREQWSPRAPSGRQPCLHPRSHPLASLACLPRPRPESKPSEIVSDFLWGARAPLVFRDPSRPLSRPLSLCSATLLSPVAAAAFLLLRWLSVIAGAASSPLLLFPCSPQLRKCTTQPPVSSACVG